MDSENVYKMFLWGNTLGDTVAMLLCEHSSSIAFVGMCLWV